MLAEREQREKTGKETEKKERNESKAGKGIKKHREKSKKVGERKWEYK